MTTDSTRVSGSTRPPFDWSHCRATFAQELVHEVTDEFGLSTQDVERLCARAAGNPLYLVELLRAVLDAGSLEDLPDTLEDIIASRIDRLPRRDRRALRVAAVLGDRFDVKLLEELGRQLDLDDAGALLTRLGEFLSIDRHDLVFEHDLVRQVAYEGLPFARRRALHRSAASLLAEQPGRPDDNRLAMLAEHWHRSGDHAEAFAAQRRAAERALRKFAHHEASILLQRAVDNGEKVGVESIELARLAEQCGDAAELAGRFDAAITGYRTARRHRPHARRHPGRTAPQGRSRTRAARPLRRSARLVPSRSPRGCGSARPACDPPPCGARGSRMPACDSVKGSCATAFDGVSVPSMTAQLPTIRGLRPTPTM